MRSMSNYIRQLSTLYILSQKPWELCQIISGNCLPCMFYLRNHESYVKLYQAIVSLVRFISEPMRVMSNYISQTIVSLVCIKSYVKLYQTIVSLVCLISEPESYVKLYQTDNCLPCTFYLGNHESYVKSIWKMSIYPEIKKSDRLQEGWSNKHSHQVWFQNITRFGGVSEK